MKKRWIPFIALTLIMIFVGGILLGSATEVDRQSEWVARINIQDTIAIVNTDVGIVDEDESRLNYSAAIINALEEEFVQASPALAETGFLDGTFGAIITFPYFVSERVVSFNDRYPQIIQLEFMINPNLPEREYVETYVRILNLQMSINTTLAHTYVNSIFGQLHSAQGQVGDILANKERDLTAMEIIALEQFSPTLYLDNIPEIPFDPESFDGSGHFISQEGFASAVAALYRDSFSQASSSYLAMREGLFVMTEEIPEQADEWLVELEEWADDWEEYAEALEAHKDFIIEVIDGLNNLLVELSYYLDDVEETVEDADEYFWDLSDWHDDLEENYELLEDFLGYMLDRIEAINNNRVTKENFEGELDYWYENLDNRYGIVEAWQQDTWQPDEDWFTGMGSRRNLALNQIEATISARPDRAEYDPEPPAVSTDYLDALGNWYVNLVNNSAYVLNNLLEQMAPQFSEANFPAGVFDNLTFYPTGERPDGAFSQLSTAELDAFIWGNVGVAGLHISPFERELPDIIEHFEYQTPGENAPESEEGFLDPLSDMRGQIETFEVDAYMTDYLWQQVEGQIGGFGAYLDSVGGELGAHVGNNYTLLTMVYAEYVNYLTRVRQAAIDAESNEIANLLERLERFYEIHDVTRLDTIARLIDFSGMMPESRTEDGVNLALVNHTVTPFEFTPPVLREDTADMFGENSLYSQFGLYLWIGISLILLVFLATLSSYFISSRRKRSNKNAGDYENL